MMLFVGACRTGAKLSGNSVPSGVKAPAGDSSAIVATVDTVAITKNMVEKLLQPMTMQIAQASQQTGQTFDQAASPYRKQITAQLIVQSMVEIEAKKSGMVADAHKVDSIYKAVTAQFKDSLQLAMALAQSGDTPEGVKEKIAKQVVSNQLLEKKLADSLKVPQARIDSFYAANKDQLGGAGKVRGRHILKLVKSPADSAKVHKEILDIQAKLAAGGNFTEIAKAQSDDPGSKEKGGDMGWFDPKDMVPEFAAAAKGLELGKISAPVRTQYGWHIIQIQDRKSGTPPALDSVKPMIEQILKSEIAQRVVPATYRAMLKAHNATIIDQNYKEPSLFDDPKEGFPPEAARKPAPGMVPAAKEAPAPKK